jgi:hypothetical protein
MLSSHEEGPPRRLKNISGIRGAKHQYAMEDQCEFDSEGRPCVRHCGGSDASLGTAPDAKIDEQDALAWQNLDGGEFARSGRMVERKASSREGLQRIDS